MDPQGNRVLIARRELISKPLRSEPPEFLSETRKMVQKYLSRSRSYDESIFVRSDAGAAKNSGGAVEGGSEMSSESYV